MSRWLVPGASRAAGHRRVLEEEGAVGSLQPQLGLQSIQASLLQGNTGRVYLNIFSSPNAAREVCCAVCAACRLIMTPMSWMVAGLGPRIPARKPFVLLC